MLPTIGKQMSLFDDKDWDEFISKREEVRKIHVGKKIKSNKEETLTVSRLASSLGVDKKKMIGIIEDILKKNKI